MLREYIDAALRTAQYKIHEDGTFYGEIPGTPGVWANEPTLEQCRTELEQALEDWILFSVASGLGLPAIGDVVLPVPSLQNAA